MELIVEIDIEDKKRTEIILLWRNGSAPYF